MTNITLNDKLKSLFKGSPSGGIKLISKELFKEIEDTDCAKSKIEVKFMDDKNALPGFILPLDEGFLVVCRKKG